MVAVTDSVEANKKAVKPIFEALEQQGRMKKWLAEKIGISKNALRNYELGIRAMPQSVFDKACVILGLPSSIAQIKLPIYRPGRRPIQKLVQKGA